MMRDPIGIPSCFSSGEKAMDDSAAVARSGQCVFMSVYRTKIADQCRLITVTWYKNLSVHGLSVSVEGPEGESQYTCKVELKPWYFWRKQGSKRFVVDGKPVDIFWDLKAAKFKGETEPISEYYVAVVSGEEVVLLLGDLKKDAFRKTRCRPALIDPTLVSRKEHVFGMKKFLTRVKFHEKGRLHEISTECKLSSAQSSRSINDSNSVDGDDPEMEIRIDGHLVIHVSHLQWKFRGNETIHLNNVKIEVYWDVHDWLFSSGLRHVLFILKPSLLSSSSSSVSSTSSPPCSSSLTSAPFLSKTGSSGSVEGIHGSGSSNFSLFLYAWKVE
ncbi:Kinesin heavy chain [Heracleum sosnowskyi]|uniref:Kinesin heavy chain n=1 Tax=Heracleum sosnowskyi TaxID=360622 RepID=A0AAD8H923_9APIA|nr:Kinesin heavy chain [Heracleum sosnowskyi]